MKRNFDEAAQTWDENPVRRQLGEAIGKAIITALPLRSTHVVLDYGAGTGLVSLAICPLVSRVLAADSSNGMLSVLSRKAQDAGIDNIEAIFLDLEDPAATPPAVDVIVSSMTLHHVNDIPRLARIFFSMLGPDGRIALADLATEAGDFHPDTTGVHHFGFDPDELRKTFATVGFADVRTTIAHTVHKPVASGETKAFPIVLLTARKP